MKYDRKAIMTEAWRMKKLNPENDFGICLSMAWASYKHMARQPRFEVVYCGSNVVKHTFHCFEEANRESDWHNKVNFDSRVYIREVA